MEHQNKFSFLSMAFYIQTLYSDNLNLSTTGALVQGRMASSVTTAVTRLAGVTSYVRFNGVKFWFERQSFRGELSSDLSIKSSGSPEGNR